MTRRQDGWVIVLAGFWNRSIFMPEWVGLQLFEMAIASWKAEWRSA